MSRYLELLMKFDTRPWFIVNGDTNLLSKLKFTGADLKHLQNRQVAFYFYEPLFSRSHHNDRCPAFFDEDHEVHFPELDWLEDFCHNNGIKKVTAYVCDYRLKEYCEKWNLYPGIEIRTWDIFLADLCRSLVGREKHYQPDFFYKGYPFEHQVDKKYICLNYRYEGFRELMAGYLSSKWQSEGFLSFFHRHDREHFLKDLPLDPRTLSHWPQISAALERIQTEIPLTVDTENSKGLDAAGTSHPDADGKSNQRTEYDIYRWYNRSFLAIVNETRYGTYCGEISEKTLLPIQFMRPFLVVGGPKMLRYLREMGFETFSDVWDESYDDIEDHGERMKKILDVLDEVLSRPLEQLQQTLKSLEPRLLRNRRRLLYDLLPRMHQDLRQDIIKIDS
ncbi:hypothetical protein [Bdellovibrio sp. HCB2-146]|uniref:hypothetical protein n=1 Tax=Bdellovibrio sp. HCB2-146 TaxID=3394362 RepID=UPI0039BD1946